MDSFAIWYEERAEVKEEEDCIITLNYNLWKLDDIYNKSFNYVLDIGMKIKKLNNISEIYLYIPFNITKQNLRDLGQVMIKNKKIIDGIFNENCKVIKSGYENAIKVEIPREEQNRERIKIFALDYQWQDNIKVDQKDEGTVINIHADKFNTSWEEDQGCNNKDNEEIEAYFRFRIQGKELKSLVETKKIKDNMFKTYSEKNDIIDFRVNEKRSMPESLVSLINSRKEFKIEAIQFLLLMDMKYTLASTGLNYSARALETKIWDDYLDRRIENVRFVAYHWKQKPKKNDKYIENFNSLIRIEDKECNLMRIIIYVIVAVFLSCVGNFIYDSICKMMKALLKFS